MPTLTANELKTKGVSAIEKALNRDRETVISVRGKPRYVVVSVEEYERLREAEIYSAWQEARQDVEQGRYRTETAQEHTARLQRDLQEDGL